MTPTNGFAHLPSELFAAILDEIDAENLQHTVLALLKTIPQAPIPPHYLFRHVRLVRPDQPWLLHQRLGWNRYLGTEEQVDASWIRSFKWLGWTVDADVLINLLAILPSIVDLHLNIGTTFVPEHLEDLFRNPRTNLHRFSLRFRPYFKQATYYQFLAGSYFDSFIDSLSTWPEVPSLTTLSIVPVREYREQAIVAIMDTFPRLLHLILDHSGLGGIGPEQSEWRKVGQAIAKSGIKKAREKERQLQNLDREALHRILDKNSSVVDLSGHQLNRESDVGSQQTSPLESLRLPRFRILPPYPRLITLSSAISSEQAQESLDSSHARYAREFNSGWVDGIARVREHRERAIASGRSAKFPILQFDEDEEQDHQEACEVEGSAVVEERRTSGSALAEWHPAPLLCFGCERDPSQLGSNPNLVPVPHQQGCSHARGRESWMPPLYATEESRGHP